MPIEPISRHNSLKKIKSIVGKSKTKLAHGGFSDSKLRDSINSTFYTQPEEGQDSPKCKEVQKDEIRELINYIATAPHLSEHDLGISFSRTRKTNRQVLLAALQQSSTARVKSSIREGDRYQKQVQQRLRTKREREEIERNEQIEKLTQCIPIAKDAVRFTMLVAQDPKQDPKHCKPASIPLSWKEEQRLRYLVKVRGNIV